MTSCLAPLAPCAPLAPLAAGGALPVVQGDWLAWVVLFLPLLVALLVTVLPVLRRRGEWAAWLSIGSVAAGFLITLLAYFVPAMLHGMEVREAIVPWVGSGELTVGFGTRMDALALTMTLVVTAVGLAIFVYALGYMRGDESMGRFYAKFCIFVFSMLGITLAPNFFQTFVFWELVGASSYFLIGYYWRKHSAGEAAKKAFMTNRVGDFGFLLGILMVWTAVGHFSGLVRVPGVEAHGALDFAAIEEALGLQSATVTVFDTAFLASVAAALVFAGAMGKSAQFPLHVWLPDAMEGPTPVSALMHAATMVAAGVYMVTRCFFLFENTTWAPTLLAWVGTITAFLSGTMALTQRDIKKILAYSTLSQLGYMTMALGAGAYTAAMFHLTTHAFFKALLFLTAGSAIQGCHHEQDIFAMGGLRRRMPSTYRTFVVGTLALCGIFPFAGFWSKDEILGAMSHAENVAGHGVLFWVGVVTAGLTAFYMGRLWVVGFLGEHRGAHEPHESPRVMTWPLWALAFFSLTIGLVGIPGHENNFEGFLHAWHPGPASQLHLPVAAIATLFAVGGLLLAFHVYRASWRVPKALRPLFAPTGAAPGVDPLPRALGPVWTLWNRLYYIDDLYLWLVKKVQDGVAYLSWVFERWVVIGTLVNGTAYLVGLSGDRLRRAQNGRLSAYVTAFALGAVVLAGLVLLASCAG